MVREARLQLALAPHGVRLPTIRAVCEDESVLGVPFYVMDYIDADVVTNELPPGLETEDARRALGLDLVDTLVEIHAVDVDAPGVADFIRPGSYLERQVRRFTELWGMNQTRDLPAVVEVGEWLAANLPEPAPLAVVHGDYRLGNMMVAGSRIVAVLDWEMGAVGDPARRRRLPARHLLGAGRRREPARHLAGDRDGRAFPRATSSSSATPSGAAATSSRSPGSRRSRSGRRPSSARRSTAGTSAASSPPRTRTRPASSRACRSLAETALALVRDA